MRENYKIYCDMDGVLVDFNKQFRNISDGINPNDYEKMYGKTRFWDLIHAEGVEFWSEMSWMLGGKDLWEFIKDPTTELLSAPSVREESRIGKTKWVENNIPDVILNLEYARDKKKFAAPNHILIDDHPKNISDWVEAGGIGILHHGSLETIFKLKNILNGEDKRIK